MSGKTTRKNSVLLGGLLGPGLLILLFGYFIPLILLFIISFYQGIPGSGIMKQTFTLENYARFFDPYYAEVLYTTIKVASLSTLLSLALGYPIALLLARSSSKVRNILLAIVLTPLLTNVVARTLGLMIMLGRHGPINQLLGLFGVTKIDFIPGELGIVIGLTQVFMPYMILSISSVLSNINFSLQEAARDLGCNAFTAFWKIIFPLSMPGVVAGSLFVFLLSFSSFVTPRLLGGGKVMVMTMLIYQQAMQLLNWPFAAAVAIILLLVSIVLVTLYSKFTGNVEARQVITSSSSRAIDKQDGYGFWDRFSDWRYELVNSLSRLLSKGFGWLSFLKKLAPLTQYLARVGYLLILLFIIMPLPVVILSSFSQSSMITFPPMGYSVKWYSGLLERMEYIESFLLSLRIALLCVVISLTCGTLASLALVRYNFRGKEIMKSLFLSPLMLPAVIVGISILRFLVSIGWVATFKGILLAHLVLTTAYVVRTISASLVGFDITLEEAARDLGANAFYTFRHVTLPIIKPGLIVAGIFAFIVSFDETTVSMFITGGRTITLSVRIFSQLEYGLDPTVTAISSLLILMAVGALFVIGKVFGLEKFSIQ